MSDEKKGKRPVPAFIKPGDDPELDRLLAEAKRAGGEPSGLYYYDVFGRRKRLDRDGTSSTVKGKARMTRQSRVLALAVLGIVGPLLVMAMVAFLPPRRTGAEVGSHGERGSAVVPSAMAVAVATEVLVATGPLLADGGATVPKQREDREDAGAAPVLTAAPSGREPIVPVPREPARPKAGKSGGGAPYEAAVPPVKTAEVVPPPLPPPVISAMPVAPLPPPTSTSVTPSPSVTPAVKPSLLGGDKGVF